VVVCVLKIFLFVILMILMISILFIIFIKKRNQAIQIYSIQTFLGSGPYNQLDNESIEQKKSLIDSINDFFKDSTEDENIDDNEDIDGDGAGE